MFDRFRNFHEVLRNSNSKAAPDKTFFFLIDNELVGHIITQNKTKPFLKKIAAIQQMKRPESKKDVMKLPGVFDYYSKYFPNVIVILAPMYNLLHDDVSFH